jgi:hypothetical protein
MSGGKRQNPQWLPEAFRESNTVFHAKVFEKTEAMTGGLTGADE